MKFISLFAFIFFIAFSRCSSDTTTNSQGDTTVKMKTVVDSSKSDTSKKETAGLNNKVSDSVTVAPQGGNTDYIPDATKFFLALYAQLQKGDATNWSDQFTDEIKARFKSSKDEKSDFDAWKKMMTDFVEKGCGGDPKKVIVTTQPGDGIVLRAGKGRVFFRADVVNGEWKIAEK